ncbi:hypothetical protein SAMN05444274_102517 [Mariniphaga anaerophila]|uniref:Uncharacterized protein n=1 Tax=Mariniphaga anaerophila TaxID=1484053 RepID=A0A1M4WPW5_9BACT|nr:symporter small accessory protein [Mariniphaga anaerophila]SHE83254.1 hypothetical protein SAMN05444274_102517 [Mariniphaga anaerophila]
MIGISDSWILLAYLLCALSTIACVVYGVINWNKGAKSESDDFQEESDWKKKESEIEESL